MTQRKNNIVARPEEEKPASAGYLGFCLLSLPSKYPPVVRPRRKRRLRLIRETRRRFSLRGGAKFTVHSAMRSAAGDDDRRDAAI